MFEEGVGAQGALREAIEQQLRRRKARPVFARDLDRRSSVILGDDGLRYREVDTNLWVGEADRPASLAYLSVGRHGGSIMLEPMFLLLGGVWYNVSTGRPAPMCLRL